MLCRPANPPSPLPKLLLECKQLLPIWPHYMVPATDASFSNVANALDVVLDARLFAALMPVAKLDLTAQ